MQQQAYKLYCQQLYKFAYQIAWLNYLSSVLCHLSSEPDNTPADDSDNPFTTTTYDELSRKIAETDLAGRTTQYEYSNAGNLTAVIDALEETGVK